MNGRLPCCDSNQSEPCCRSTVQLRVLFHRFQLIQTDFVYLFIFTFPAIKFQMLNLKLLAAAACLHLAECAPGETGRSPPGSPARVWATLSANAFCFNLFLALINKCCAWFFGT